MPMEKTLPTKTNSKSSELFFQIFLIYDDSESLARSLIQIFEMTRCYYSITNGCCIFLISHGTTYIVKYQPNHGTLIESVVRYLANKLTRKVSTTPFTGWVFYTIGFSKVFVCSKIFCKLRKQHENWHHSAGQMQAKSINQCCPSKICWAIWGRMNFPVCYLPKLGAAFFCKLLCYSPNLF